MLMKKKWVFFIGVLTGVLLVIAYAASVRYLPELMHNSDTD